MSAMHKALSFVRVRENMNSNRQRIIAVCGKGGVGKTVFSALFARALMDAEAGQLLLVDGDPAGGLAQALGENAAKTLSSVREQLIGAARTAGGSEKESLARSLDYLILEALVERPAYSLLAMGRNSGGGCYCPANVLLRDAIDAVSGPFRFVIIDAEAGLEQISRQVTRRVTDTIIVSDGSRRSVSTLVSISEMAPAERLYFVLNMSDAGTPPGVPENVATLGSIPEDAELREYDRRGRPILGIPNGNPALEAVRKIAVAFILDEQ